MIAIRTKILRALFLDVAFQHEFDKCKSLKEEIQIIEKYVKAKGYKVKEVVIQ